MEFAIATVGFWEERGFNCQKWRKSIDETKALVHLAYAELLIPDIRTHEGIEVHSHPSEEFIALLSSSEWTEVV